MSEDASVLFANDAFYNAFASSDMQAMEEIWVRDAQPTCVHPGWLPLVGHRQVMKSWRDILEDRNKAEIACSNARLFHCGDGAYVICHEHLDRSFLIATNIFVREARAWKIKHHQAGALLSPSRTAPTSRALQ
jgi:hypothetical protein